MESIAPGNDALRTLLRNFVAIVNAESIPIFCFYELRPTNTWRIFGYKNFGRKVSHVVFHSTLDDFLCRSTQIEESFTKSVK